LIAQQFAHVPHHPSQLGALVALVGVAGYPALTVHRSRPG
jgi:hypothetical protein